MVKPSKPLALRCGSSVSEEVQSTAPPPESKPRPAEPPPAAGEGEGAKKGPLPMWPGYVGIVFDKANHNVTTGALDPGWAFINPFTQAIQEYPVTIQTYQMVQKGSEGQIRGDDSIKIQSNEGQQINLDVVIQYQVEHEKGVETGRSSRNGQFLTVDRKNFLTPQKA